MTRLTNEIRKTIKEAVLRHRFEEQAEALVADRAAFAGEVYNDVYRKSDRDKMEALPNGWLPTTSSVSVRFGETAYGRYEDFPFDGAIYGDIAKVRKRTDKSPQRCERRVPHKHYSGCSKVYGDDHRLSSKHAALKERADELQTEIVAAARQVTAALDSANTVKQLLEAWPEVEPFVPVRSAKANLPAVPVDALNKLLDLPVAA